MTCVETALATGIRRSRPMSSSHPAASLEAIYDKGEP
jgi:hypothetical protein